MARPVKASAFTKADGWFAGEMDHDTAQDYLTGEEYPELEEVQPGSTVDVQALQQRIQELEGLVQHQQSVPVRDVPNGPSGVARSKAPPLFQQKSISGFVSCRLGAIAKISWKSSTKGGLRRNNAGVL